MSNSSPVTHGAKAYFDYLSSECQKIDIRKRLLDLALFLHQGGDMHECIGRYRTSKDPRVTESVYTTLLFYLVYLRTGQCITTLNCILSRQLNEFQLIEVLSAELKARLKVNSNNGRIEPDACELDMAPHYDLEAYAKEYYLAKQKIIFGELLYENPVSLNDTREAIEASNPWIRLAQEIEGNYYSLTRECVHPADQLIVREFNSINKEDECRLLFDVAPEPFWGNPLDAKIVILTLNPGYVKGTNDKKFNDLPEERKQRFIKAKCRAMSLRDEQLDLYDEDINNAGQNYWKERLQYVTDTYEGATKKLAIMQFLGYHSESYKDFPNSLLSRCSDKLLHTQHFTIRIVRYLMQQGKVIIIARSAHRWYEHIPELKHYPKKVMLKNYRQTYITQNNCKDNGWELIDEALKDK